MAALPAVTGLGGVWLGVLAEGHREKARRAAEVADRVEVRRQANADRVREFELEHLTLAYDAMWKLLRRTSQIHMHDVKSARAGQGYGGTQISGDAGDDVEVGRDATRVFRRLLDDDLRRAADDVAREAAQLGMLGVRAHMNGDPLVTEAEGVSRHMSVQEAGDQVMQAMAARIRALIKAQAD